MPRRKDTGEVDVARLLADAWLADEMATFHGIADDMIEDGQDKAVSRALSTVSTEADADEATEMLANLMQIAEMGYAAFGEREIASIDVFAVVVLPVDGNPVPHEWIRSSIEASDMFPDDAEILIPAGWCTVSEVTVLAPTQVRRLLNDLARGLEPSGLRLRSGAPAAEPVVLVGVAVRTCQDDAPEDEWSILQADDDDMEDSYATWRTRMIVSPLSTGGVLDVVRPCPVSMVEREMAVHVGVVREQAGDRAPCWPVQEQSVPVPIAKILH